MDPAETLEAGPVTLMRWDSVWVEQLDTAIRASMPELRRFMPWATDEHGLAETREFVERSVAEWESGWTWNYAIFAPHAELVGSCGLMDRMGPDVLEIGYWVDSAHTGRGYASAAAAALAVAGLGVQGIARVALKHDVGNPASGRVAANAGFTQVGQVERERPGCGGVLLLWERLGRRSRRAWTRWPGRRVECACPIG
jgi:ribosomal-protein-serine acetyltransferase